MSFFGLENRGLRTRGSKIAIEASVTPEPYVRGLHERFLRSTTDSGHACCGITELQFLYIVEMTFDACESSRQAFKILRLLTIALLTDSVARGAF